tara:strand:- start:9034 stop:9687 length:654 start_codon:yes stop_codon:yes gene_type:complete
MKTANQEQIQKIMDEGDYAPMYPIISKSNLHPLEKILVSHICNDIRMNGTVTWKHQTYADKTNTSRQVIYKYFKKFVSIGLLVPHENNKAGSKSNKFDINLLLLVSGQPETSGSNLKSKVSSKPETSDYKPETSDSKPETSGSEPETSGTKPETPVVHIKKPKETNKENNKEILKKDINESSFYVSSDIKDSNAEHLRNINQKANIDLDMFLLELDL